jgi:hypothetical protein
MKKSPLSIVKERFQDKTGLVNAVKELATDDLWIDRVDDDKGLDCVSNKKLLRLHGILSDVKKQFGTRAKLIETIAEKEMRSKDEGYKGRLARFSTPRLYDQLKALQKRVAS